MELQETLDRMHAKKLYYSNSEELLREQWDCLELQREFNQTMPSEPEKRAGLMKKMFAEVGEACYIEPPFHANWGGKFVHFGNKVYANFNLTLVDDTHIYIGDYVMIGPNVTISAGSHPIHPGLREKQAQFNLPVTIGKNVWIGANAVILPGVTIGENSVIGAGSIVTKDIPANVVAVGNPCRVMREISDRDMRCYYQDMEIDID